MLNVAMMKFRKAGIAAALALAGLSLSGCVVYPSGYAYNGYGYGYGYAPAYVAPPVVSGTFFFGGGGGCCWRGWR